MRRTLLLTGLLFFTACVKTGPVDVNQPTESGAVMDTGTGTIGANEATPETVDSLEIPAAGTGVVHGKITHDLSIHFGDAPSTSEEFYIAPTLLEFISYDCEYCHEYALTVRPWIVSTYVATHRMNIERFYVPLTKQGDLLARAAICAAEHDAFDAMDEYLFSHPLADMTALLKQAAVLKLSPSGFKKCLNERFVPEAPNSMGDDKVTRVPLFRIGTTWWLGVETKQQFKQRIEAELKK